MINECKKCYYYIPTFEECNHCSAKSKVISRFGREFNFYHKASKMNPVGECSNYKHYNFLWKTKDFLRCFWYIMTYKSPKGYSNNPVRFEPPEVSEAREEVLVKK